MASAEPAARQQFHLLYNDHHRWLQGWLRARLGNAADAFDLTQDTFVRVLTAQAQVVAARDKSTPRAR